MNTPTVQEMGYPAPAPDPIQLLGPPLGDGRAVVPHFEGFQSIWNTAYRQYRSYNGDEALRANPENALAMRRDPVVFSAIQARKRPTVLLSWHIEPHNPSDEAQVQAAKQEEDIIKNTPNFTQVLWWLDEAIWNGRYGVQTAFQWDFTPEHKQIMVPRQFWPVNGDKLAFHFDGSVGVRVQSSYSNPKVKSHVGMGDYGKVYWFDANEREQLTIHKFEPEDADWREPEMAGAVHGVGLRSKLYWAWAAKNDVQKMLFDYLNWFARGMTVYYYDQSNPKAFVEVQTRIREYAGKPYMAFPRTKDGGANYKPIERFEPGTAPATLMQNVALNYYDDLLTRAILGQTLSTGTDATGMGSGVAQLHGTTFDQVIKYDSLTLADTLTMDFLRPLYRTNHPGMPAGRWVFELDTPNVGQMLEAAQVLYGMGASLSQDSLMDAAGLSPGKPGETILSNIQSTQPAAVDGVPTGVPIVQGNPQQ